MSDELFEKIIQDLADIPEDHKFSITLARINEPLLDRRLKDFSTLIGEKLPNATQLFWSNGSTLKPGKFEWVSQFPGADLTISLNSVEEKAHTDLMGFGLKNVIRNLDYMHGQKAQGAFDIQVRLTATHQGQKESTEFVDYCTDRWPLFNVSVTPYFTWQGDIAAGQLEAKAAGSSDHDLIMNSGLACGQWFDLHILANGRATKCCIDEAGHKSIEFDLSRNHALEVFRQTRQLRQSTPDRRKVPGCEECSHLG